ncbi:MAG: phosphoglucosamine mutase, partial [Elusimicrobiota bacterium]|nr:phosphoglucosamine mutase [Elusimicrobiota bacterium]
GDKYVFEALEKENLSLGGETSGHIIFKDISPAGDGILSALILLSVIKKSGRPASWFKTRWSKYPLKLIPVKVKNKTPLDKVPGLNDFIKNLQAQMGAKGRIFVRYSGTEPLLRILVEGENKEQVENFAEQTKNYYLQHNGENL